MNLKSKYIFFGFIILIIITLFGLFLIQDDIQTINSKTGVINLNSWNNDNLLNIEGEWSYYPDMLKTDFKKNYNIQDNFVEVPHIWASSERYGYATYKINLLGLEPEKTFGIIIPDGGMAYRVNINDKDVIVNGNVARTKESYKPERKFQHGSFTTNESGEANIYIEITNYDHNRGGFWESPIIGDINTINNKVKKDIALEVFFITSIITMGIFFLVMYIFAQDKKILLYMSFLCILISLRGLLIGQRLIASILPFLSWNLRTQLEYLIVFLLLPVAGMSIYSLEYVKKSKPVVLFYLLFAIASLIITTFLPYDIIYQLANYYNYLIVVFFIYFSYQLLVGTFKKIEGAWIVFIGFLSLLFGGLMEIFLDRNQFFILYGTLLLIIFITIMVISDYATTKRINKYLEKVKKQNNKIKRLYNGLNHELDVARKLHENTQIKAKPINGISLATYFQPAEKLGGDFFDIIEIEDKIVFFISDVTGHDISSNMISIFVKNTINNYLSMSSNDITPSGIVEFLTEQFFNENFPEDYFVCIFVAVLNLNTKEISYLGNGFQFAPLACLANNENLKLEIAGLPISTAVPKEIFTFHEKSVKAKSGASFLFYTDGIAEQEVDGKYYYDRMEEVFYENCRFNPKTIKKSIINDFKKLNNDTLKADDDITFIITKLD